MPPITFTDADFKCVDYPQQDDLMVISVDIDQFTIRKTLVDQGSSVYILYWKTFKAMRIAEAEMMPYDDHLVGFSGERVGTKGYIEFYTTFGEGKNTKTIRIRYLVIDGNTSYIILLDRPSINWLMTIVSTPHLAMKFSLKKGDILTVNVDQKEARECYVESLWVEPLRNDTSPKRKSSRKNRSPREARPMSVEPTVALVDLDPRVTKDRLEAREELRRVPLLDEEHNTAVGMTMAIAKAEIMHVALKKNMDMFTWTPADMSGVSPDIITHRLSIFRETRPISQKKRDLGNEKRLAAKEEAEKLLSAGFIREARYTTSLANVVMVTKPNGNWRMCVDY